MQTLIIATSLPTRRLTSRLQVDLPIASTQLTNQEIKLPPEAAPRRGDNRVSLERPRVRRARVRECKCLVGRRVVSNIKKRRCVGALDRGPDLEVLTTRLGTHYGDRCC